MECVVLVLDNSKKHRAQDECSHLSHHFDDNESVASLVVGSQAEGVVAHTHQREYVEKEDEATEHKDYPDRYCGQMRKLLDEGEVDSQDKEGREVTAEMEEVNNQSTHLGIFLLELELRYFKEEVERRENKANDTHEVDVHNQYGGELVMEKEEVLAEHEDYEVEEQGSRNQWNSQIPQTLRNQHTDDLGARLDGVRTNTVDDDTAKHIEKKEKIKGEHVPRSKSELIELGPHGIESETKPDQEVYLQDRVADRVNMGIRAVVSKSDDQKHQERRAKNNEIEEREATVRGKGREVRNALEEDEEREAIPY